MKVQKRVINEISHALEESNSIQFVTDQNFDDELKTVLSIS
jgi:hypothetical protein